MRRVVLPKHRLPAPLQVLSPSPLCLGLRSRKRNSRIGRRNRKTRRRRGKNRRSYMYHCPLKVTVVNKKTILISKSLLLMTRTEALIVGRKLDTGVGHHTLENRIGHHEITRNREVGHLAIVKIHVPPTDQGGAISLLSTRVGEVVATKELAHQTGVTGIR